MSNTFEIYIAQKPYQAPELGKEWREHRFFMLADSTREIFTVAATGNYIPEQELHYVRMKQSGLLKAMVYPMNRIARPINEITLLGAVKSGTEYEILGDWNRALTVALELNKRDLVFADVKNIKDVNQLNTCDAGIQAGLDAMGVSYDFGRAGLFNSHLFSDVQASIPDTNPSETLQDRRKRSEGLMKMITETRKRMVNDAPIKRVG